jgi:hypothetical protein
MTQQPEHSDNREENGASRRSFLAAGVAGAAAGLWGHGVSAQGRGRGRGPAGRGRGPGRGRGRGGRNDPTFEADHDAIQTLLLSRNAIRRRVTNLPDGVETLTETDNERLRGVLVAHVDAMYARLEDGRPIHQRDPLFAELFRHRERIEMSMELTERGIRVTETSDDPHVVRLIQSHAAVVSLFLKNGHEEVRKNHAVPV